MSHDLNAVWEDVAPWLAAGGIIYLIVFTLMFVAVLSIVVWVFRKVMKDFDEDWRRRP